MGLESNKVSRQKFYDLAAANGIGIEYSQPVKRHPRTGELLGFEIVLDAPEGKQFMQSGCRVDCGLRGNDGSGCVTWKPDWAKCLAYLQELISDGIEDAEEEE